MAKRLLVIALTLMVGACASTRGRESEVRVRVVNAARYTISVRTCSPDPCSEFRRMRPGTRTTFIFPWTEYRRHIVEGWDGDRVAIRVPVDFEVPGTRTVTLVPRYHPQQPTR